MSPVEAADLLRQAMQFDPDVRMMVMTAVERKGYDDFFNWVDANPDEAIALAEQFADLEEQLDEFESRLSTGDLS